MYICFVVFEKGAGYQQRIWWRSCCGGNTNNKIGIRNENRRLYDNNSNNKEIINKKIIVKRMNWKLRYELRVVGRLNEQTAMTMYGLIDNTWIILYSLRGKTKKKWRKNNNNNINNEKWKRCVNNKNDTIFLKIQMYLYLHIHIHINNKHKRRCFKTRK